MKESAETTIIPFDWATVAKAFFKRYPNPFAGHVLSEDTISREIRDKKFLTRRVLVKRSTSLPKWTRKFVKNQEEVVIVEEIIVDPSIPRLVSSARNLNHVKILKATETTEYLRCFDDPDKTMLIRHTTVSSPIWGFSGRLIERFSDARAVKNAKRALQGLVYTVKNEHGEAGTGRERD